MNFVSCSRRVSHNTQFHSVSFPMKWNDKSFSSFSHFPHKYERPYENEPIHLSGYSSQEKWSKSTKHKMMFTTEDQVLVEVKCESSPLPKATADRQNGEKCFWSATALKITFFLCINSAILRPNKERGAEMEQTWKLEAINKLELAETTMIENFSPSKVSRESADSIVICAVWVQPAFELWNLHENIFILFATEEEKWNECWHSFELVQ